MPHADNPGQIPDPIRSDEVIPTAAFLLAETRALAREGTLKRFSSASEARQELRTQEFTLRYELERGLSAAEGIRLPASLPSKVTPMIEGRGSYMALDLILIHPPLNRREALRQAIGLTAQEEEALKKLSENKISPKNAAILILQGIFENHIAPVQEQLDLIRALFKRDNVLLDSKSSFGRILKALDRRAKEHLPPRRKTAPPSLKPL